VLLKTLLDDLLSRELDRLSHSPVVELLETVEPPYLQIVCEQLWELNKTAPEKTLQLKTYETAGKAKGILKSHLKTTLSGFNTSEKNVISMAFHYLGRMDAHPTPMARRCPQRTQGTGRPPTTGAAKRILPQPRWHRYETRRMHD
jgi:hypothetical protein